MCIRDRIYFIENHFDAEKIAEQVLVNKRSRESAEKQRLNIKKKLSGNIDISNRVQKFVDCRSCLLCTSCTAKPCYPAIYLAKTPRFVDEI